MPMKSEGMIMVNSDGGTEELRLKVLGAPF